jgi:two-component system copper resistance phosphate regulon response regulator CusR
MKVLLIENDPGLSSVVARGLGQCGFTVEVVADGRRGLNRALGGGHEVVLLDLLLPDVDGNRILTELRRRQATVPVLVISARDGVGDRVRALNEGADDFLVKPFCFDELVARMRALARRPQNLAPAMIEVADLRMDLRTRRVERAGHAVSLTAKEFALLGFLLRHRGVVVTRAMIAEHVWGQHFGSFSNVIDVYIRYLRAKIDADCELKLIHTLRGVGYVLSECLP